MLFLVCGWLIAADRVFSQDEPKLEEKRVVVGKLLTADGTLLQHQGPGQKWEVLKQGADLYSGVVLLQMTTDAEIESKNGAVVLHLIEDVADDSPYRAMESSVVLHENPDVDFDFTLLHGVVGIENIKEKGEAKVLVKFRDEVWEFHLQEPGTRLGLQYFARWPQGVPFVKEKEDPPQEPLGEMYMLVIKGEVIFKHDGHTHHLKAPPGPAGFHWDSVQGEDTSPTRLEKLPPRATPESRETESAKKLMAALEQLRQDIVTKGVQEALLDGVTSSDPALRYVSVIGLGATNDLKHLADALADPRRPDVRDTAITVLRGWIGRGPGQDHLLFESLQKNNGYSERHAEIILTALHTPSHEMCARPELYEILIEGLQHPKLAVRELARWHLYRCAPAGKDIEYDAAASKVLREIARLKWLELIPEGQLPPAPKLPDGDKKD